jgi:hypothetical protein
VKRLAAALLVLAGVATADEIQTFAPGFCNGVGYCGTQLTAQALDAGVEQVEGDWSAFHVAGNRNAPKPTCLSPGGWWKTCTVVQGDNFMGTIVLSDGDGGVNPVFANNASLALIQPSIQFPHGGGCMVQIGNIDAGQGFTTPPLIFGEYYDGGCNVILIKGQTGSSSVLNHGIAFNYMMGGS